MSNLYLPVSIVEGYDAEYGVFILGFSKDSSLEEYLTIQMQTDITPEEEEEEEEEELNWTKYYLELGNLGLGGYNTVKEIELKQGQLLITLSKQGVRIFEIERLELNIEQVKDNLDFIKKSLLRIFENEKNVNLKFTL